jgi:hypothetical protein
MVPTQLWGLTDPLGIGHREQVMMPLSKQSLGPLFVKHLKAKAAWWIPSLERHWLPFGTNDCPGGLNQSSRARQKLRMA